MFVSGKCPFCELKIESAEIQGTANSALSYSCVWCHKVLGVSLDQRGMEGRIAKHQKELNDSLLSSVRNAIRKVTG